MLTVMLMLHERPAPDHEDQGHQEHGEIREHPGKGLETVRFRVRKEAGGEARPLAYRGRRADENDPDEAEPGEFLGPDVARDEKRPVPAMLDGLGPAVADIESDAAVRVTREIPIKFRAAGRPTSKARKGADRTVPARPRAAVAARR